MDAPPQLLLSALTWFGGVMKLTEDHDWDMYIGTYSEALTVQLKKIETNARLGVVYIPEKKASFVYTREVFIDNGRDEPGEIIGEDMSPSLRICLPGRLPWPERFKSNEDMDMLRKTEGPPFLFFVDDFNNGHGIDPDMMGGASGIDIRRPDLPGQTGEWYGAWAPTLLEKQKRQKPLGERTQVIWNATTNPTWGVEVRLEALKVEENEDLDLDGDEAEDDGGPMKGISGYEVRATVLRVFVKDEEFKRLQEPDEIEENEGEEEYGDESM